MTTKLTKAQQKTLNRLRNSGTVHGYAVARSAPTLKKLEALGLIQCVGVTASVPDSLLYAFWEAVEPNEEKLE